jgi:AraC-like DNA-binding protein
MIRSANSVRLLEACFSDVDALCAEVRSWDLDFRPLKRASGLRTVGTVIQSRCGPLEVGYAKFSVSIEQRGAPPTGTWTFAVPEEGLRRLWWRGRDVDAGSVLVFPVGGELRSFSGPDFEIHTISVSQEAVARSCERLGLRLPRTRPPPEVFHPSFHLQNGLRRSLRRIRDQVGHCGELEGTAILDLLVAAWLAPVHARTVHRQWPRARDRAIHRCLEVIEYSDWSELSPDGLRAIACVSERTLQQVFRERFDLTPAAFLKARRLAAVRQRLLEARHGEVTVGAEAASLGFWHVGQFAADYRRAFGETPSATLNRRRGK